MGTPYINLPNLLTLSRIAATPVFVLLVLADAWYWRSLSVAVFTAASLTDYYDGRLARSRHTVTEFGRFMDPLADKILVLAALGALAASRVVHLWLVIPVVVRDIVVTGLRLRSMYVGRQLQTSRLAKAKTMTQLCVIVVVLALLAAAEAAGHFGWQVVLLEPGPLSLLANGLMAAVLILTVLSGFHYLVRPGISLNESR
jgi:CDP-diacylglycerol--glycerol-3-phosphate 3-phosphatidyltransferase